MAFIVLVSTVTKLELEIDQLEVQVRSVVRGLTWLVSIRLHKYKGQRRHDILISKRNYLQSMGCIPLELTRMPTQLPCPEGRLSSTHSMSHLYNSVLVLYCIQPHKFCQASACALAMSLHTLVNIASLR